jgi:drug/metabolite transporter (DMT)-like permease
LKGDLRRFAMTVKLPLLAATAAGVQVGAAIVASRYVVAEVPPLTLALLRYAIGFVCLLPFALKPFMALARMYQAQCAIKHVVTRDLAAMALLGMGQFALLIALLNYGLQQIAAAQAALIFSLFPLLTLVLSTALGRERVTPALLGGVLLSIAGVAVSLIPKLGALHAGPWWGELAVLASACIGALCSVLYRPYLRRYPTLPVSAFAMLASVLLLALLALQEDWPALVGRLGPGTWAVVAFIGLSSAVGYACWLYALKHESPTRVTIFLALNPVTAAVLGVLFLHEPMTGWTLSAIALIASGLSLATRVRGAVR